MRALTLIAASVLVLAAPAARACSPLPAECLPRAVVFPAYTAEGAPVGVVGAPVRQQRRLELSRFTGQPLTVIYNDPDSVPGAVDPYVDLVPLRAAPRAKTVGGYPKGY